MNKVVANADEAIRDVANGVVIGGNEIVVMAGPCSVESREQLFATAEAVAKACLLYTSRCV